MQRCSPLVRHKHCALSVTVSHINESLAYRMRLHISSSPAYSSVLCSSSSRAAAKLDAGSSFITLMLYEEETVRLREDKTTRGWRWEARTGERNGSTRLYKCWGPKFNKEIACYRIGRKYSGWARVLQKWARWCAGGMLYLPMSHFYAMQLVTRGQPVPHTSTCC